MPKPSLPFLHRYVTQHGKVKFYVKTSPRQPGRGVRVKGQFRSEEFMTAYHALVRGVPTTTAVPVVTGKDGKGTVGWLIRLYRQSRAWCEELKAGTQAARPDPAEDGDRGGRPAARRDHADQGRGRNLGALTEPGPALQEHGQRPVPLGHYA